MRALTFALASLVAIAAGSVGCAAIIGLDSGDPVPDDGGSDEAATTKSDSGADSAVVVDSGPTPPTCAPDTADCNGDSKDGCETKLDTPMHCSSCTDACSFGKQCQAGACCNGPMTFCVNASDCCTNKCDGNKCSSKP